jgi:[glutamine synthetase] adenylyltransferase / [glutamine synthetase]-adenylyl-L-tyrosine phosphorylase
MVTNVYRGAAELLSESLSAEDIRHWLMPLGFDDWEATHRRLLRIAGLAAGSRAFRDLLPYLLSMLSEIGNPDRALVNLERFLTGSQHSAAQLHHLATHLRAMEILIKLFAGSQFLTEILLRNPEYFAQLTKHQRLAQLKSKEELLRDLPTESQRDGHRRQWNALRQFQRAELLRIGTCDLLDLLDLPVVTAQLSNLADTMVQACLDTVISWDQAVGNDRQDAFVVLALGKLGGQELNYSSDIDLLFLASNNASEFQQPAERLISALTEMTEEGFLYRVDMRLRPWGRAGPLVTSVSGYLRYLSEHARIWEKQALLKARPIAGNIELGESFLLDAAPLIYQIASDQARNSVRTMRQLTESALRQKGRGWGEVKLGAGSIRDIEFLAQYLQLAHGGEHNELRSHNTLDTLARLSQGEFLSTYETRVLSDGYIFLRVVEHYLQMMHYRQTHTLPQDPVALAHLARRLGFDGDEAGEQFVARYEQYRTAIRAVYLKHLGERKMDTTKPMPQTNDVSDAHIARMDAAYTSVFSESEIQHHAYLADHLNRETLIEVEAVPRDEAHWQVTIVGYDYPGELSLICGLLFAYGFSIEDGQVFTYEPRKQAKAAKLVHQGRRKIVDVFTVAATRDDVDSHTWGRYAADLRALLRTMQDGQPQQAHGELVKRVAAVIAGEPNAETTLYPVDIQIDNATSDRYTLLHISAPDTLGFLYELTNALAYNHIYIARVSVASHGGRAHDILFVTDANGKKIVSEKQQRELRAAVVLIKHFTHLLPHTPDPETGLLHFREFINQLFRQENWPDELASLENPAVLSRLARVLGISEFLWDDFLRMQYTNLFPVVRDADALQTKKSREQLQAEIEEELARVHSGPQPPSASEPWRRVLNAFKDREMFRIDMRHILGHTTEFWDFSEELTALAEVVVNAAYHLCHEDLRSQYGSPLLDDGNLSEMTVCALGKCGGHELGFASDIELMFLYTGNGQTSGPNTITTAEFYEKLVQMFLTVIEAKREGIFEIDLRLRPYGKAGSMAVSMPSFRRYFAPTGPAWAYERQALVKLRPIAGNAALGETVVALRDAMTYAGGPFDVTAMRAMRERQIRHLVTGGTFNAKYSPGGLVDIEYLVQGLQITYGGDHPSLRCPNIREAMQALAKVGLLSETAYEQLRKAHTFLRWLIDGMRMVRGNAKDLTVPPVDSEAFAFLARRLRYGQDTAKLQEDLTHHTTSVMALNQRLLGQTT